MLGRCTRHLVLPALPDLISVAAHNRYDNYKGNDRHLLTWRGEAGEGGGN